MPAATSACWRQPPVLPKRCSASSGSTPSPTGATTRARTSRRARNAGIAAYVARPQRGSAVRDGLFRKEEFRYDPTSDTYRCPGGQHLHPLYGGVKGGHTTVQYCNRDACRGCELKSQCTANTYRRVGRWTEEAVLDRMEVRLAARTAILKQRREIAEHPFGSIKQWMNQGTFLLRWLEKVRAEFSLTALAYNFIRMVNIVGVASLLKAM